MDPMIKKSYRKPELKTRRLELGVFGDYSGIRGDTPPPSPLGVIRLLDLRME